jgi:hypothetical protein
LSNPQALFPTESLPLSLPTSKTLGKKEMIRIDYLKFRIIPALFLLLFTSSFALSQIVDDKYDEFILKNKLLKPYCGYVTIGTGLNFNFLTLSPEKAFSLAYHFRVKNSHFQTGYHVSSDKFFMFRSYQMLSDIFFLYGHRKDSLKYNYGFYAGPTYGFGSTLAYVTDVDGKLTNWYKSFHHIGLYAEAEYTYKINYDFGLGLSVYTSLNEDYCVGGLKVHLYFSGAFRGNIE